MKLGASSPTSRRIFVRVVVVVQYVGEPLEHLRELAGVLRLLQGRVRPDRHGQILDRRGEVDHRHAVEQRCASHLRHVP
ncbi:hypothetical protein, partial [Methylorubrum sp. DB1722]|uniref:hypothetical protein n=1 Tax=Methylorubrum sp. DB1722 TaxID=2478916 RepID=UPI0018E30299